ncbi:WD40-repeat-containing domain protein [Dichomitus squalens]|uniref:WD40-repeat-containing domain protein n=1 Tax=Dichomitus squalens TaxID=114155 RepID=A0A4Q9PCI2_9APHY|nr:WD40-repeat-containing domain protein [Dichomitus squalens]
MPPPQQNPWNIYAEQLFPMGFGYPLWIPEPSRDRGRQVYIGDVGWIKQGEFRALFNCMKPEDDPVNEEKGVPLDFQLFNPKNVSIGRCERIGQKVVASSSIRTIEAQGDVGANAGGLPAVAGAGFSFKSTSDSGAFVMLAPPGIAEDIESKRHIVNHMRENFTRWLEFANASSSWGLDLNEQQMLFVCGTLKTTHWAVAAFQGNVFRSKEGYVSGDFGPTASAGFSVKISNEFLPANFYRTGPPRRDSWADLSRQASYPGYPSPSDAAIQGPSQCLFIHYYKMKRRFWLRQQPMQATAGPHQLPPGPDNSGLGAPMVGARGSSPYDFEPDGVQEETYDPVDHLLTYILENSEAAMAVASDLDLIALFMDRKFPEDVPEAIAQLGPSIEVDEYGVGTVSVNYTFLRKRRTREEEDAEDRLREEKRGRYLGDEVPHDNDHVPMEFAGPSQAYGRWDPAGSSAAPSYGGMGDPSMHSHGYQYPQGMQHPQGMPLPLGVEYQHSMPYQQDMYSQGMSPLVAVSMLDTPRSPQGAYPPGIPLSTPMGYLPADRIHPAQNPPLPPANSPLLSHGGMAPPPPPPPYPQNTNDDEEMGDGGSKAEGKRPDFNAPTSIHDGSVTALAYSADGKYIASGSEDTTIIIWDALANSVRHKVPIPPEIGHTDTISALAFSRDNIYLASASHDEGVIIWAVANGRLHLRIQPDHAIHSLVYTPDGRFLIGGASDGTLYLWNAQTYEEVRTLDKNTAVVTFVIFSPDGRLMATGGTESVCTIWETAKLEDGEPLNVLEGHRGMVCAAAFSPDNRRIITASDDGSSRIWNAETGEALVILHEHTGPVWTVAFSPDGKRIASGSSDSTVKICDSFTGDRQLSLDGHDSMINAVEFSPNGKFIASAASDNTVRLWNASDGSSHTTYNEHNDNVTSVMFSSDGSTLASGSHDGTVHIRRLLM